MPQQDHGTPGQIRIVAGDTREQQDRDERRDFDALLDQIDVALNKLDNQWDGWTAAQRAAFTKDILIGMLKAWRFVLRRLPRLARGR